jgi:hypothetical protein
MSLRTGSAPTVRLRHDSLDCGHHSSTTSYQLNTVSTLNGLKVHIAHVGRDEWNE